MAKGIVRKLDELGRITLPMEIRKSLGFETGQAVSILQEDDNSITIRKSTSSASCCGCSSVNNVVNVDGINLCENCRDKIYKALGGN